MKTLRRYTNLASTIHLLATKTITLLNPATWDDKNDAYFMAEYKRYKEAKTVLALCFTDAPETYHHWRVFSHGSDGVRLEFDKEKLLSAFPKSEKLKRKAVKYMLIDDAKDLDEIRLEDLPFLKRIPYEQEDEYRIVYVDRYKSLETCSFGFKMDWINRITLSPWMSKSLAASVRETLKNIEGCSRLSISRSTLTENEEWKKLTSRVRI